MGSSNAAQYFRDPVMTSLATAIDANSACKVKQAVANGADPNGEGAYGITPLFYALHHPRHLAAIEALLAAGANPNDRAADGLTAMALAVQVKNGKLLRLLLKYGGDPNLNNDTELLTVTAAFARCFDNVWLLLDAGADINAHPRNGQSLLMTVARLGFWEQAREALRRGADPFFRTDNGGTIPYIAQKSGTQRMSRSRREEWLGFTMELVNRGVSFPVESPAGFRARTKGGTDPNE